MFSKEEPAVVRADPLVQARALLVCIGGIVVGYVALRYCRGYLDELKVLGDRDPLAAIEKLGNLFRIGVLTLTGSLCAFALLLGLLARRILNENRFPPRSMKVITDTRVVTGEAARSKGRMALVLAGTILAFTLCLLLWAWRVLKTLESALN